VDDATLKLLAQNGIDFEGASGAKHHELPVPAVFLVAINGLIQFEYINPDYTVRAHPDVLLAAARVSRSERRARDPPGKGRSDDRRYKGMENETLVCDALLSGWARYYGAQS
jgi:hypothetical protein